MAFYAGTQHVRAFVEGIEIPVRVVNIQSALNSPSMVKMSVVPSKRLKNIPYRSMVHIFCLDISRKQKKDENYICIFEGEYLGRGVYKDQKGRLSQIICMGALNHLTGLPMGLSVTTVALSDAGQKLIAGDSKPYKTPKLSGGKFLNYLFNKNNNDIGLGLKDLLSVLYDTNDFMRSLRSRFYLFDKILTNISKLGRSDNIDFDDIAVKIGWSRPFFVFLTSLLEMIEHYLFPITTPLYSSSNVNTVNAALTPDLTFNVPPMCNVIYPKDISSISIQNNIINEITRMRMIDMESRENLFNVLGTEGESAQELRTLATSEDVWMPRELADLIENNRKISDFDTDETKYYSLLTEEEKQTGIVDAGTIQAPIITKNTVNEKNIVTKKEIAEMLFYKKKFSSRAHDFDITFDPHLLLGHNALILDSSKESSHVLVFIQGIQHILSSSKGSSTTIKTGFMRYVDETQPYGFSWLDEYSSTNINSYYQNYGSLSATEFTKTVLKQSNNNNPVDYSNAIYNNYVRIMKLKSYEEDIHKIKRRSAVTLPLLMGTIYNAEKTVYGYKSDDFDDDKSELVKDYALDILDAGLEI